MLHCNNKMSVTNKEMSVTRHKINYNYLSNVTIKNSFVHASGSPSKVSGIFHFSKQFYSDIKL